ncbi:MAG: tetratricopeptide repeat protein [Candidatus Methanofastidiosia archaeon]|jgi:tetratricopeptide (TPR) repeat protein
MSITHPKILYLFSAPLVAADGAPLDALDMETEKDAVVSALTTCKKEILLRIGYATIDELFRSIEDKFNILHVSCHGYEEFLLFEDGKGGSQPVTGDYLKRFICMGAFELAIVSACYSEKIAELLIEAGVQHVVAIKSDTPVADHAAIVFIGQFYRSLFKGDSVQKAFNMAQLLVEGNPDLMKIKRHLKFSAYKKREPFVPEEKKFVLLQGSTDANPSFSNIPHGTLTIEEPALPTTIFPVKPQSFTGRSTEMHDLIGELLQNRFVTITGVGGIGKTVLAIEVARWACSRSHFFDGGYYIDLRLTDTADGVIALLGAAFELELTELKDVIAYLEKRHCLLLFDNAEDILWEDEDALHHIINSILKYTVNTTLLITSQRPVGGNLYEPERVYRIHSLEQQDAALLFCATTKRKMLQKECKSPIFHDVLEQLGGHPLSIVITARQLAPGITLEDVCKRISVYKAKALNIKRITDKDLEHGESLVASLASAHHVLSDNAQTVFELLSLLPAGAHKDMLTKIYGSPVWEYVQELNNASLVEINKRQRVTLLPPVRLFAQSILREEIKKVYIPKIIKLMEEYAKELYNHHSIKGAKEYRFSFTKDEPNLCAAVDLPYVPASDEASTLGSFGPYLLQLYIFHNRWQEAEDVGDRILFHLRELQDQRGEAHTLTTLGMLAFRTGNLEKAQKRYEKALTIYQGMDEKLWEANTVWALGNLSMRTGALKKAQKRYEKALALYKTIDRKLGEANTLMRLGDLFLKTNNFEKSQIQYEKALALYKIINRTLGEANTLMRLGDLFLKTNSVEKAQIQYEKALTMYRAIDVKDGEARILIRLAQQAALTNRLDHAEITLHDAHTLYKDIEDLEGQADAHLVKAFVLLNRHYITKAKKALDCCLFIQDKIGAYTETAQWLTIYAAHLTVQGFEEGAKLCSQYAEECSSKALLQRLQSQ